MCWKREPRDRVTSHMAEENVMVRQAGVKLTALNYISAAFLRELPGREKDWIGVQWRAEVSQGSFVWSGLQNTQ